KAASDIRLSLVGSEMCIRDKEISVHAHQERFRARVAFQLCFDSVSLLAKLPPTDRKRTQRSVSQAEVRHAQDHIIKTGSA
ncbi:MAG TPA: hypothetical protein DCQ79_11215, partial [Rhizobiales bacterium]|nr:hypothetical protein [Hyphomicrobiales bacterium]